MICIFCLVPVIEALFPVSPPLSLYCRSLLPFVLLLDLGIRCEKEVQRARETGQTNEEKKTTKASVENNFYR